MRLCLRAYLAGLISGSAMILGLASLLTEAVTLFLR